MTLLCKGTCFFEVDADYISVATLENVHLHQFTQLLQAFRIEGSDTATSFVLPGTMAYGMGAKALRIAPLCLSRDHIPGVASQYDSSDFDSLMIRMHVIL
jgi:hypothetical protein